MRDLEINKQSVYYALAASTVTEITDSAGNYTGERDFDYGTPVEFPMNISARSGNVLSNYFGNDLDYTRIGVTSDMECPINETSRLWIGMSPTGSTPHNYNVKRVARSLNSIAFALKEVDVS